MCNKLEQITIPNSITKLGNSCFRECGNLTNVEGLEHVKEIGDDCFGGCDKLNQNVDKESDSSDDSDSD